MRHHTTGNPHRHARLQREKDRTLAVAALAALPQPAPNAHRPAATLLGRRGTVLTMALQRVGAANG